jgi:pimeloyl-ACP methyl ester carboxylesterase
MNLKNDISDPPHENTGDESAMPYHDRKLRLADGRILGYAEFGTAGGKPVFYFHGLPASRIEARLTHTTACRLGIRIVAPDRPGFGLSDRLPGRRLADWPEDVAQLADALGLNRFAVLGVSAGGPYAIACACLMPKRLTAIGLVGALGPIAIPGLDRSMKWPARFSFHLARDRPRLAELLYAGLAARLLRRRPLLALLLLQVAEPDRPVLQCDEVRRILQASIQEAFRHGGKGAVEELKLLASGWGLALQWISRPVHLWHGEKDRTVPVILGRHLAAAIPHCQTRFFADEGHFSLPVKHMEEILQTLVAADPKRQETLGDLNAPFRSS